MSTARVIAIKGLMECRKVITQELMDMNERYEFYDGQIERIYAERDRLEDMVMTILGQEAQ